MSRASSGSPSSRAARLNTMPSWRATRRANAWASPRRHCSTRPPSAEAPPARTSAARKAYSPAIAISPAPRALDTDPRAGVPTPIVRLAAGSYSLDVQVLRRHGNRGRGGKRGAGTGHHAPPGHNVGGRRERHREGERDEADERQPGSESRRDQDVLEMGSETDHPLRTVRAH